jgi:predicted metalloprotease with PDZ domain
VRLNIFADRPEAMVLRTDQLAAHRNLVREAYRLFGNHRFDHYDFLMALSDQISPIGLEHARSSEDGVPLRYFSDWEKLAPERDLLPHEFTHSWNGKFRRPADLYTATFETPMRDSLLWVYEGQTQYWGRVLAARAGLVTRQQALDLLAQDAAAYEARIGRRWRPLQDTANEPVIGVKVAKIWPSWQRGADYYVEGALIWLDVDTVIREQTKGQRSLDDFARSFFGAGAGEGSVRTYTFDDVTQALNAVLPYDWASFLRARLDRFGGEASAPLDGLARGGYRLVYTDLPNDSFRLDEARRRGCDLTYSLGLSVDQKGVVREVIWEGPAYRAGLAPGAILVALNGVAFDPENLKDAVRAGKTDGSPPLELIVRTGDNFKIVRIAYHGGLRYPRLERDPAVPARLDDILAPHARRGEGG